jgi:NitT/TauT family transport system ATP-binding protein
MDTDIIQLKNVGKTYIQPHEVALENVNLSIKAGEFVCLIGPSGGGKTTLLKIIAGLEKETVGEVIKPETISMSFQGGALFPWLTVYENVAFGLRSLPEGKSLPEKKIKSKILEYIEMMKLNEFINKRPAELSGGQRQRVGIARALAVDPSVLLLDEPFSALDAKTTAELHDDLIAIWRQTGKTIVLVSHIIEEAVSLAERIVLIKNFTVADIFKIDIPYPRREQELIFHRDVMKIRKEFFK